MANDIRQQDQQIAAAEADRRGGAAARIATQKAADTSSRGGDATDEVVRGAGETAAQSAEIAAEGGRQLAVQAAEQVVETGRHLAQAVQGTAEEVRRLTALPDATGDGLRDMRQALEGLVEGVVRANLRATQDLLHLADPASVVEVQQRLVGAYLGALAEGRAVVLRAARRIADEALRPLEERPGWGQGRPRIQATAE